MRQREKFLVVFVIVVSSLLQVGWLAGRSKRSGRTGGLTFYGSVDSINVYLKSNRYLGGYVWNIARSKKYSESIPVLEHVILEAKRPYNRAEAAKALVFIWRHTKDNRIPSILRRAIRDSAELVQIEVLKGLYLMGEDIPLDVLERLAKGEGKENWVVDFGGIANPYEVMTEDEVEKNARMFRDNIQFSAISIYWGIKRKQAEGLLREVRENTDSKRIKLYVDGLLRWIERVKEGARHSRPPFPVGLEIPKGKEEEWAFHRAHLREYLRLVDSLMYDTKRPIYMDMLIRYIVKAGELSALGTLQKVLYKSPYPNYRMLAAKAIGEIEKENEDTSAIGWLRGALRDTVTEVRLAVAEALIMMGDYETPFNTLIKILNSGTTEEKLLAAKLLVRMGKEDVAFDVISTIAKGEGMESWTGDWKKYFGEETPDAIKEAKNGLRYIAIDLLARMKSDKAMEVLRYIAKHDKDPRFRKLIQTNYLKNKGD